MVHVQAFFFSVENVNNNTNEHVQDKEGASDHVDHEEENLNCVVVLDLDSSLEYNQELKREEEELRKEKLEIIDGKKEENY